MSVLESDYEHEFLLGLRLMERALTRLSLTKPECQERIDKVRTLAKWTAFPGVQALILKVYFWVSAVSCVRVCLCCQL